MGTSGMSPPSGGGEVIGCAMTGMVASLEKEETVALVGTLLLLLSPDPRSPATPRLTRTTWCGFGRLIGVAATAPLLLPATHQMPWNQVGPLEPAAEPRQRPQLPALPPLEHLRGERRRHE